MRGNVYYVQVHSPRGHSHLNLRVSPAAGALRSLGGLISDLSPSVIRAGESARAAAIRGVRKHEERSSDSSMGFNHQKAVGMYTHGMASHDTDIPSHFK